MVTTEQIKELRDKTGISVMQCKKALEDAGGDMEKAVVLLRKKGADVAAKKAGRTLGSGVVQSYIHSNGRVGAMVILLCETDFVANNQTFKTLAYDIAMQVTATNPEYLKKENIPEEIKESAKEAFAKEVSGKPKAMQGKIMEGKLAAYFKDKTLLDQQFIKDNELTVGDLVRDAIQKFGEKIEIEKFVRFSV
jgi:elongation factor Ts